MCTVYPCNYLYQANTFGFLSVQQFALCGQKGVRMFGSEYKTSLHFSDVFLLIHLAE